MIKNKLSELNETLLDLIIGIILFSVITGILGMLIVKGNPLYMVGILAGMIEAIVFSFLMLYFIDGALDMNPKSANAYMIKGSLIRYAVMIVTGVIAIKISTVCFAGLICALFGIKVAAFIQPFVNLYITKKLMNK